MGEWSKATRGIVTAAAIRSRVITKRGVRLIEKELPRKGRVYHVDVVEDENG